MKATETMLASIKEAVAHMEKSWDAQRDFELEVVTEFDCLSSWICDLAAVSAEGVDIKLVQDFLDSAEQEGMFDDQENEQ